MWTLYLVIMRQALKIMRYFIITKSFLILVFDMMSTFQLDECKVLLFSLLITILSILIQVKSSILAKSELSNPKRKQGNSLLLSIRCPWEDIQACEKHVVICVHGSTGMACQLTWTNGYAFLSVCEFSLDNIKQNCIAISVTSKSPIFIICLHFF